MPKFTPMWCCSKCGMLADGKIPHRDALGRRCRMVVMDKNGNWKPKRAKRNGAKK